MLVSQTVRTNNYIDIFATSQDRPIDVYGVYQYDYGVILRIYGLPVSNVPEVHFANSNREISHVVIANSKSNGLYYEAQIPNDLLEEDKPISAYVYQKNVANSVNYGVTCFTINIYLTARQQYDDNIYTNAEISSVTTLIGRLNSVLNNFKLVDDGAGNLTLTGIEIERST